MPDKESVCRHLAEHYWLWVVSFILRRLKGGLLRGAATLIINTNIAETNVFDLIAGNAGNYRCILWCGVIGDDIADDQASDLAFHHCFIWAAIAFSESNKDR